MPKEILIVEDDESNRRVFSQMFQEEGFKPHAVRDGWEALAYFKRRIDARNKFFKHPRLRIRSQMPHIILTDYRMPGFNGVALSRMLHGMHKDHIDRIPTLLISAETESRIRAEEPDLDQVIDSILPKPFDIEDLLAKASELVFQKGRIKDDQAA